MKNEGSWLGLCSSWLHACLLWGLWCLLVHVTGGWSNTLAVAYFCKVSYLVARYTGLIVGWALPAASVMCGVPTSRACRCCRVLLLLGSVHGCNACNTHWIQSVNILMVLFCCFSASAYSDCLRQCEVISCSRSSIVSPSFDPFII